MNLLRTVTDLLQASTQNPARGGDTEGESAGAYWCMDCSERLRDVEVDATPEDPPACPSCGDPMEFERSAASTGCAC